MKQLITIVGAVCLLAPLAYVTLWHAAFMLT